jgi:hypothetical protein
VQLIKGLTMFYRNHMKKIPILRSRKHLLLCANVLIGRFIAANGVWFSRSPLGLKTLVERIDL